MRISRTIAASSRARGILAGLSLLAVIAPPILAQDVTGAWDVRWAQAVRVNGDGSVEIQKWGDAELVLEQDGSRVTGSWTTDVLERVQWRLSGTIQNGRLRLEATDHDSTNEELAIVERIDWEATVRQDGIEGHVFLVIRGRQRAPGRRPFAATRAGTGEVLKHH